MVKKDKTQLQAVYKKLITQQHRYIENKMIVICHANINFLKVEVAIFITDKVDFRAMKMTGGKGGHYLMIKALIYQENIKILNV